MCQAYAKKSLLLVKKVQLRRKYRTIYKKAETMAFKAKKQKDYKNASKWFSTAARLRKRHTEMYFDGKFDKGHKTYYNNMLRAAEKCRITAINIKKQNQKKQRYYGTYYCSHGKHNISLFSYRTKEARYPRDHGLIFRT